MKNLITSRNRTIVRTYRLVVAVCIGLVSLCLSTRALAESTIEDFLASLVQQSTFIFEGTVVKPGATTMSIVPVTDTTVIVRVDQVFQVPTLLGDYTDKEITLLVQDAGGLKRGEQAIFFTQGWLVGASVAVQEVGRVKKDTLMNPDKQIDDARRHIADQNLRARLASANLVIAGQVERVRMASEPTPPSEHAPQWMESILAVEAVLKGNIAEHVVVFFPASRDIAWFRAPKFQTGQEGIWILQRDRERDVYTALDPLDFQPKDQLERIKVLLK